MKKQDSIYSMTGFGEHTAKIGDHYWTCRLRSLNGRFLELKVKLPDAEMLELDMKIRRFITGAVKRGSLEAQFSRRFEKPSDDRVTEVLSKRSIKDLKSNNKTVFEKINATNALAYLKDLSKLADTIDAPLKKKLNIKNIDSLVHLLRLPAVISSETSASTLPKNFLKDFTEKLLEPAIEKLVSDRKKEGTRLKEHLLELLSEIESNFNLIAELEPSEKESARKNMEDRIQETLHLLAENSVASNSDFQSKLYEEASFWIEKRDFTEELVRFKTHVQNFREVLEQPQPTESRETLGRRLEFMHQELLREINTLSNKAQSLKISALAVSIKTNLEKIKEQIANVE